MDCCINCTDDGFAYLAAVWGREKTVVLFAKKRGSFFDVAMRKFTVDELVKYEMWDGLEKKKSYPELIAYAPFPYKQKAYKLLNAKDKQSLFSKLGFEFFYNLAKSNGLDCLNDFLELLEGIRCLAAHKEWDVLSHDFWRREILILTALGLKSIDDFFSFVLKQSGEEAVAKFYRGAEYLIRIGKADVLAELGKWYTLADAGLFQLVDWEAYDCSHFSNRSFLRHAEKAKKWDILEKYKCRKKLFWHFRFCRWRRTFRKQKG